jgi:glycosyltransferase involved in cell wall biosynthesis
MNEPYIYLDTIVFRIQNYGGASTYWKELLANYYKKSGVNIVVQDSDKSKLNIDGKSIIDLFHNDRLLLENAMPVSVLRYLPLTTKLPAKSIYHASYYRVSFQRSIVNIFTVHDFTHKRGYASKFPRKLVHIGLTAMGLKKADGIICISENTKKDLMLYYPQIPETKVKVIYHGVSDAFYPIHKLLLKKFRDELSLNEPFTLFVGKREGYKKFDIVPAAVSQTANLKLFIVGGGPLSVAEQAQLERILPGRYFKLENVSNQELNELYNYAHSLIYPSIYEGFGIPLLEAMKAGCPVITNQLSSLGEIAGDAALFVNEVNAASLTEKLNELNESDLRSSVINKGFNQSAKFTWERCANETYSFYQETYNKRFNKSLNDL